MAVTRKADNQGGLCRYCKSQPRFFHSGLAIRSHPHSVIAADSRIDVIFEAPLDGMLLSQLEQNDKRLEEYVTFTQRNGYEFTPHDVFPRSGEYVFRLFAKRQDESRNYSWDLTYYRITVKDDVGNAVRCPTAFAMFNRNCVYLYDPLEGKQ